MKDEIKQMIDNLKFISEQESATIEINQNGCKVILDYITNLQEKLNRIDKLINTDYGWVSYYSKYNNMYLKSEIKEDINNILKGDKND